MTAIPSTSVWFRSASAALLAFSVCVAPAFAKDPFRISGAKPIGDRTSTAFEAMFKQGDYVKARDILKTPDAGEPLGYAMQAAIAYLEAQTSKDYSGMQTFTTKTRDAAQALVSKDEVRGNLYLAVASFLEAGYEVSTGGAVKGAPAALSKAQEAFKYLETAESKAPNDPEVNLIKGYIDLFTSPYIPFSSPSEAMARLEKGSPRYLVDRGRALGYRDQKKPGDALAAVEQAIANAPGNPELLYLKAQILVNQGKSKESLAFFDQALSKKAQLPASSVKQIERERGKAEKRANKPK